MQAGQNLPHDPLGAFCRDNHVALAATGSGTLDGLGFGAKDVFDIAGVRTGFGNPDWLASHAPAAHTAEAVRLLLAAGAHMVGKTLTDELTYSLTGENHYYGTPVNAAAPDRIPGGSSNGSASAVAGCLVDFALGTDCGGSVRLPASYCGILGMRPTHARVTVDGVIPFAPSFDVVGWFARDAAVFERVGAVLLGEPPVTRAPQRLLLAREAFDLVAPEVQAALQGSVERLAAMLGAAQDIKLGATGLREWFEVFRVVQGAEIWGNRRDWIERVRPAIGPGVRERIEWAATITTAQAEAARAEHRRIRAHLRGQLKADDVVCLPTSPRVAPLKSAPADLLENDYRTQAMCLLCIAGLGGLPQVNLPIANLDGLPLGVSLIGAPDRDMQLLAAVRAIMAAAC